MKLSTKGEYGLLAMIDLALYSSEGPVQSQQIAGRQHIPKQYLDQLMLTLKKAGLVESSRGRQGGYGLARPARTITILDIVTALEGPLENINFLGRSVKSRSTTREILNNYWNELFRSVVGNLQGKTLEVLCDEHKRMQNQIMYYI
jgi:Rrf2 family transcriptional regulator, cysteine metabolism repressor